MELEFCHGYHSKQDYASGYQSSSVNINFVTEAPQRSQQMLREKQKTGAGRWQILLFWDRKISVWRCHSRLWMGRQRPPALVPTHRLRGFSWELFPSIWFTD